MAEIGPFRELPPLAGLLQWRPSVYCSVSCRRGRINDQAWKIRGEREGNIERVRHMALLEFEIMMLD